jgi:hypothetical protein
MQQYLLTLYQPDGRSLPPERLEQVMRDVAVFNKKLKDDGAWVFGAGLHPASASTVVRVQGGEVLMTDGPFAEGKEHMGGFVIVNAEDLDAALEYGRMAAAATTLPIEVRPIRHGSDEAPD